jgi:aryl-alcohol dehydrogenase-like predicted oxidoreductase
MGLGCWAIGGAWRSMGRPGGWGAVDDDESMHAIRVALDLGITFFDTAANYGAGHSERILGRALAGRREQAVIATKFGFRVNECTRRVTRFEHHRQVIANLRDACEQSLARLATDHIDLFQLHLADLPEDPALELRERLEELVREGKIRSYGWSTDSPELAQRFAAGEHCAAIQHDLNVCLDAPGMVALCERADLASLNRSPLARGALTGKYTRETVFPGDDVRNGSYTRERFFQPAMENLEAIRDILTSQGRSLAQGALAWLWARSPKTIPIPGFRSLEQVKENAAAMGYGPLAAEQMDEIDKLLGRV